MSLRVSSLVWKHSRAEANELLVLLAIADFCDENGQAYPAVSTLAKMARCSQRTVQRSLRLLCSMLELTIESQLGPKGVNTYSVQIAKLLSDAVLESEKKLDKRVVQSDAQNAIDSERHASAAHAGGDNRVTQGGDNRVRGDKLSGVTNQVKGGDAVVTQTTIEPSIEERPSVVLLSQNAENHALVLPQTLPQTSLQTTLGTQHESPETAIESQVFFDAKTGTFMGISNHHRQAWSQAHPALNVDQQIARAANWLVANPLRRPKKNVLRFLNTWINRSKPDSLRFGQQDASPRSYSEAKVARGQEFFNALTKQPNGPTFTAGRNSNVVDVESKEL
jgi:hypothetical protein